MTSSDGESDIVAFDHVSWKRLRLESSVVRMLITSVEIAAHIILGASDLARLVKSRPFILNRFNLLNAEKVQEAVFYFFVARCPLFF